MNPRKDVHVAIYVFREVYGKAKGAWEKEAIPFTLELALRRGVSPVLREGEWTLEKGECSTARSQGIDIKKAKTGSAPRDSVVRAPCASIIKLKVF